MSLSPGAHGGHRLAGSSLLTVAAVLVRIQAERKCGDLVLVCVNNFIPCTFLPGCAGGTGLPVALYSPSRRFWTANKRNWRVWIWFPCVSTVKLSIYEFPGLCGGNRLPGGSLRTVAAIFVRIQERKGGDLVMTSLFYFYAEQFTWAARGTPACRRISTHGYGDFNSYTSGTGE